MIKQKQDNYAPDYIPHPGLTLNESLENLGMTQAELAKRISRPEKTISGIITGSKAITPDTAIQLERALNIPSSLWNNLEKNYQEMMARQKSQIALRKEIELAKNYPYTLIAKLEWVKSTKTWEEKIEQLLSFFGVNSLSLIDGVIPVTFRQHNGREISKHSIQTWLRKGIIDSQNINTKPFNKSALLKALPAIKHFSTQDPNKFSKKLELLLSECGIAIVFTPNLPNTYLCGASRWITPEKALIQLSLRGGFSDIMWFTLYHELAHILLHSKKKHFIDLLSPINTEEEAEANTFSSNNLISQMEWGQFVSNQDINKVSILDFADKLSIHPGIIVGRLQHEKIIKYNKFNELRSRYKFL